MKSGILILAAAALLAACGGNTQKKAAAGGTRPRHRSTIREPMPERFRQPIVRASRPV